MGVVEEIGRSEHERALRLRRLARSGPHLHLSKSRKYAISILTGGRRRLSYSDACTAGDAVQKQIQRHVEFEAMQGKPVVHVKNGKPLTAEGARLLGVPWLQIR